MIYRKTYNLVKERIKEIQAEIKQNSKDIKRAADFGDLKENAEYHAAKDNQALLHNQLHRFEQHLGNEIAEPSNIDTKVVSFGTQVTYTDGENPVTVAIAGSAEYELELYENIVTTTSPFAQKIIGKQVGEKITMDLPGGVKTFEITDIQLLGESS
ncbi:MAG: GreA/GreB family elongation factor [Candidatus Marinimicrobia bacterium]|nr:GreA/GreB family elongation factor [Candidatus Neomarinimicrobiota bacterium]MCF7850896.1 GreA/GreB family elongation factor [Candidatus Neomarinimicrobiota bacterium]MCF7905180.1 GreA/GreB family elongation factor [Candidatus Neomarinimicrobiota bacterium]